MNQEPSEEVEILLGTKGYIDLGSPILMNESQLKAFMNLLKELFDPRVISEKEVDYFKRDWRIGERIVYQREWTAEEYLVLLESESSEKAFQALGRSWNAAELKDADWRYRLISFCDKEGFDLSKQDKLDIIKKFMKVQEEFKKSRKELRKERDGLLKDLENFKSPEYKKRIEFMKNMKQISNKDLLEIEQKKKDIKIRLKEIEEELDKSIDDM